jgi:hypothetical protein
MKTDPVPMTQETVEAINRFIEQTDWDAFWTRVVERATPQIEAYAKAQVKSLRTQHGRWQREDGSHPERVVFAV